MVKVQKPSNFEKKNIVAKSKEMKLLRKGCGSKTAFVNDMMMIMNI
jgi:hypothetical protein